MGVHTAALEFNVPRTTLKDRIAGRVAHGCNMGPKPYLTYEEEKELVEFSNELFEDGVWQDQARCDETC